MLYIAENLRVLRKGADFTQEDVAEALNVTPQSVSKWERGDTYPDVTLLPALAKLFGTSVDALIGTERINGDLARRALFEKEREFMRSGDYSGAAGVLTEALKSFPNDAGFMSELALAYALDGDDAKLARAAELCEKTLTARSAEKVRHTTRAALCFIYAKLGEREKAESAARELPHLRESREAVFNEFEKRPTRADYDAYLRLIALGDEGDNDIIEVQLGEKMLAVADKNGGGLLAKARELREKDTKFKLPRIRVRDNVECAPKQVRVRYYADYLLDKEFESAGEAAREIMAVLEGIAEKVGV